MPTYHPPPPSPTRVTTPSSSSSRFPSRSNSFSTSTSTPTSTRSRLWGFYKNEEAAKQKIPYFFLGSIAAASLVAHKCWPKGFPQGDKEDWELSELGRRAKYRRLAEKAEKAEKEAARRGRRGSVSTGTGTGGGGGGFGRDYHQYDGGRIGGYREGEEGRRGHYLVEQEEYGYSRDNRGWGWERERERGSERRGSISHSRSRSRDLGYDFRDGYIEPPYRRATASEIMETERYYPPAPRRYLLEQRALTTGQPSSATRYLSERSSSSAGLAAGSRFSSPSQRGCYEYDRLRPSEAVYVYQDPPPARSRRASFNADGVGRYDGGYDWYYR